MLRKPLYTSKTAYLSEHAVDGRTLSAYVRLIADRGRAITDGENVTVCTDTLTPEKWTDCDLPEEEEAHEPA